MSKSLGFRTGFVLGALSIFLLAVAIFVLTNPPKRAATSVVASSRQSDQAAVYPITLKASPISHVVQMFDSLAVDAAVIKQFPGDTRCSQMGGPVDASVEGIQMTFYWLRCDGITGYVNAKWVTHN